MPSNSSGEIAPTCRREWQCRTEARQRRCRGAARDDWITRLRRHAA